MTVPYVGQWRFGGVAFSMPGFMRTNEEKGRELFQDTLGPVTMSRQYGTPPLEDTSSFCSIKLIHSGPNGVGFDCSSLNGATFWSGGLI